MKKRKEKRVARPPKTRPSIGKMFDIVKLGRKRIQKVEERLVDSRLSIAERAELAIPASLDIIDDTTWKPRRYFGPFIRGSDFESIQVLLHGNLGYWYHNGYFGQHPDKSIFEKYYYPSLPDPDSTPAQTHTPGMTPSVDGPNDILLALNSIHYTSRYGGSVRLVFKSAEDFEYELRAGNILWDIGSLEMSIYVNPVAAKINQQPYSPYTLWKPIHLEFVPYNVVAYDLATGVVLSDTHATDLQTALNNLATTVVGASSYVPNAMIAPRANWFVHGFIHSQFQQMLGPREIVDMIEISDDFLDLHTHTGEPVFRMDFRISDIWVYQTWELDTELSIGVDVWHEYTNGHIVRLPSAHFEREVRDGPVGTPWVHGGTWKLVECPTLKHIVFKTAVVEEDLIWDDPQGTHENYHSLDCQEIQRQANNNNFGVVSEAHRIVDLIDGAYSYTARVLLLLR